MNQLAQITKRDNSLDKSKQLFVDRLVEIYIDGIACQSNDAGNTGDSIMARWIEFGGMPPPPSGMDQSNLSMIHAIQMLRTPHHHFPRMKQVINKLLKNKGEAPYVYAKLAKEAFTGLNVASGKAYSREDKAYEWFKTMLAEGLRQKEDDKNALQEYDYGAYRAGPRLIWREWNYTG